eukprot:scaffold4442_cov125-Amphora_coffeaeformis.AAC.23
MDQEMALVIFPPASRVSVRTKWPTHTFDTAHWRFSSQGRRSGMEPSTQILTSPHYLLVMNAVPSSEPKLPSTSLRIVPGNLTIRSLQVDGINMKTSQRPDARGQRLQGETDHRVAWRSQKIQSGSCSRF